MNFSDQQLAANYLAGDEKSLEELIQRYLKPVYNFVYRLVGSQQEAEDITQEVFLRVWRHLKKFDRQRSFRAWIFRIARNASLDWLKKKKTLPFSRFEDETGKNILMKTYADPFPLPDEISERAGVARTINAAAKRLSLKDCLILSLRYNDSRAFKEIAEILKEPLNTVKSRHRRALIQLKKLLAE